MEFGVAGGATLVAQQTVIPEVEADREQVGKQIGLEFHIG